jgi:glycosyltransferase involved in cell wall biosynthesis
MKLTLFMPTKNRAKYFARALEAMIHEKHCGWRDIEIVICDGGSTDETVDIIRSNEKWIDKWVSESDRGVSEAVRRGLNLATGDFIWATGDDDIIVAGASEKMMSYLERNPDIDVLFGTNCLFYEEPDGSKVESSWVRPFVRGRVTRRHLCQLHVHAFLIPEIGIYRRKALLDVGGFDDNYHYTAYWDNFFKLEKSGYKMWGINEHVVDTYQTVLSDTRSALGTKKFRDECWRMMRANAGLGWAIWQHCRGDFTVRTWLRKALGYLSSITGIRRRHLKPWGK